MEWAEVSAIAAVCIVLGGIAAHFTTRGSRETGTALRAKSAESLAAACLAKIELFASRLHEHEKQDAASFARLETLVMKATENQSAAESRLAQSLEELGERFDRMTDRIDRFLDTRHIG